MLVCARPVPEHRRVECVARRFGLSFSPILEPAVHGWATRLADRYRGGHWTFYCLCNGGFYMAPGSEDPIDVTAPNGFTGRLSADALGITACLYAFSHLSFGAGEFAEVCASHYHQLREYALQSQGAGQILAAID
jgi:hypothetical protein